MKKILCQSAMLVSALLAVASPAVASAAVTLKTVMFGTNEIPGPGAPHGKGKATVTIDTTTNQVCYEIRVSGIDTPTMAHIHSGAAGIAGPVVVPLTPPVNGMSKGCATASADVLAAILASPSGYYVNVHSATFPKGGMRGQLHR